MSEFRGRAMLPCYRILVPLLVLGAVMGCHRGPDPEPILIGHLAPFNGPDKVIGEHAKQAILLAVEEANKEENLIGGRPVKVLHPEYLPGEPESLDFVAVRLITVDRVAGLLGGINS